mmetsp:Transcript_15324/g.18652  ORF Transcript_15324/g.18652 Transcript_15324/m.18652 type:complete len:344 (-) Transcript_15324:124-1155(-)
MSTENTFQKSVPRIRLSNISDDDHNSEIVKSLYRACSTVGFFYLEVDPSDISPDFVSKVFEQSRAFFNLPEHMKRKVSDPVLNRGYTAMFEETLDPKHQSIGDTKEGYYIADDFSVDSEMYNPSKLRGPNVWPRNINNDEELNSFDCILWKDVMEEYHKKMKSIAFKLVRLLALAIGLPSKHYFDDMFSNPMAFLRLLHYSNQKSDPNNGVFACGAHSDYGMVTLLATDEQPGLQILVEKNDGEETEWLDLPPPPIGTFCVNLGDMLERWTNGKFKSTVHRVLSSGESERYSIPFFYEPDFDAVVECLDVCLSEGENPKYPKTTAGAHLIDKYNNTHNDFQSS